MREILRQSNLDLVREIGQLETALSGVSLLPELHPYYEWLRQGGEDLCEQARQNLRDLDLGQDEILPDVLSETQALAQQFRLYNERLAGPILRSLPSDQLSLRVIAWLHNNHSETQDVPAGLSDGAFSVWPEPRLPIVYFMPVSRQRGLLYLPLFFHEFAHLLYACHKPEMDALVGDLQEEIGRLLGRGEAVDHEDGGGRTAIVDTWYEWAQELYCDAVGFTIGGPSFAYAFSMYLRMGGRGEFHLSREELERRSHPLTWLRLRLLADRMREMGATREADQIEEEWNGIAEMMGVAEEYYDFYGDTFSPPLRRAIEDMLTETSPYQHTERDLSAAEWDAASSSPVHLLNRAWQVFLDDPHQYEEWEAGVVPEFLAATADAG